MSLIELKINSKLKTVTINGDAQWGLKEKRVFYLKNFISRIVVNFFLESYTDQYITNLFYKLI